MATSRLEKLARQLATDGTFSRTDARGVAKAALEDKRVSSVERRALDRIATRYADQFDAGGARAVREFMADPANTVPSSLEVLSTDPFTEDEVKERFVDLVGRADKSIDGAFFQILDEKIVDSLVDAAQRGVQVRIVTDDMYFDEQDSQAAVDLRVKTKGEMNDINIALKRVDLTAPDAPARLQQLDQRLDALEKVLPDVPFPPAGVIDTGPTHAYLDAALRGEIPDKKALEKEQFEISGELSLDKVLQKYRPAYDELLAAGVTLKDDNSEKLSHNKYMVLDQDVVWAGSYNLQGLLSDREPTKGLPMTADNVLVVESKELAKSFQTDFDQMIAGKFHQAKTPVASGIPVDVDGLKITPYFSPGQEIPAHLADQLEAYASGLEARLKAGEKVAMPKVRLAGFTFSYKGMERVVDALVRLKGLGADVRVLLNGATARASYSAYRPLVEGGVPVSVAHSSVMMHNKFLSLEDGKTGFVWTGSANFTGPAYRENDESVLNVESADVAAQYERIYDSLMDNLEPTIPATVKRRTAEA